MDEQESPTTESDDKTIKHEVVPFEWAAKKLLGPTLGVLGKDLNHLYAFGRDQILGKAREKTKNLDDGKSANLRVAKDVFFDGAFANEEICAEYFGGALASARSDDGKDDSATPFVNLIKSLSSKELRLHYLIYNAFNSDKIRPGLGDVCDQRNLTRNKLIFSTTELQQDHEITNAEIPLSVLHRQELIGGFKVSTEPVGTTQFVGYAEVNATLIGIMLYAVAHNRLNTWANFGQVAFGDFESIPSFKVVEKTLPDFMSHAPGYQPPKS